MQSELKEQQGLVPLRRFAKEDLYSSSYLSLLVQRKKLRAKKIGRNFYTTQRWFEEYLRQHAKDDIRIKYEALLVPIKSDSPAGSAGKFQPKADPLWAEKVKSSNNKIIQINFNWKAALIAAVFFIASIIWVLIGPSFDKGRIAGEEESVNYKETVIDNIN